VIWNKLPYIIYSGVKGSVFIDLTLLQRTTLPNDDTFGQPNTNQTFLDYRPATIETNSSTFGASRVCYFVDGKKNG
jgi:hypothetical protein